MTDKTEEKLAQERAAIAAMRNAQANMSAAINRIATLERALGSASQAMSRFKGYVGPNVYIWSDNNRITVHKTIEDEMAAIAKVLA